MEGKAAVSESTGPPGSIAEANVPTRSSSQPEACINIATVSLDTDGTTTTISNSTNVDVMDVVPTADGTINPQSGASSIPLATALIPPEDLTVKQPVCWSPVYSVDDETTPVTCNSSSGGRSFSSMNMYHNSGPTTVHNFPEVHSQAYRAAYKYSDDLTMCPLLLPPERDALFSLPSHREQDLFRLSDQRPRDLKEGSDASLPLTLQANQLVPREEETSESIITLPRRFQYYAKPLHDTSRRGSSGSGGGRDRDSSSGGQSEPHPSSSDAAGSGKGGPDSASHSLLTVTEGDTDNCGKL